MGDAADAGEAGIGDALTLLKDRAGLTVRDIAKQTKISSATLGGYFSGRHCRRSGPPTPCPASCGHAA